MPSSASSILVLTSSRPQADAFVGRLLAHSNLPPPQPSHENEDVPIPYRIDNKYYSADVQIVIRELGQDATTSAPADDDYPVLVWLLPEDQASTSDGVPAALRDRLSTISSPPDVSLAVITEHFNVDNSTRMSEDILERLTDAYDELGLELVDENGPRPDENVHDDDSFSAAVSPLEQITQSIQTHLWPNLVLKSKATASSNGPQASDSVPSIASLPSTNPTAAFPQSFSSSFEFDDSPSISTSASANPTTADDDFGPMQSSVATTDAPLEFTADDFSAALSSLHSGPTPQPNPQRAFTDSFAPAIASSQPGQPSLPTFPSAFDTFRPPPENAELPSSLDLFSGQEGFMRLVDDDDEAGEGAGRGRGEMVDLTSTLMNLRGLRDELGKVKNEEERRELAALAVEGLFGGLMGGEEDEEGLLAGEEERKLDTRT